MTQNKFLVLCLQHYIPPEAALENENIVKALQERNDAEVERILLEEF